MENQVKKIGLFWIMLAMQLLFFLIVITITYFSFLILIRNEAVAMTGNELAKGNVLLQLTLKEAFHPVPGYSADALPTPVSGDIGESENPPPRPPAQQMVIEELEDRIRSTSRLTDIRFTVITPEGHVSFDSVYDGEELGNQGGQREILNLKSGGTGVALRADEVSGVESIFQVSLLYGEGKLIGYTRISQPFEITEALHRRIMGKMRLANLLSLAVITVILFPFFRSFVAKVDLIGHTARDIAGGKFGKFLPDSLIREFSVLLEEINTMSLKIEGQFRTIREQNEKLEEQSLYDELTGLGNRRKFNRSLEMGWWFCRRGGHPISLLIFDIDHFKKYNDTLGHPAGDECLRRLGQILTEAVSRHTDVLVRLGGEEFGLLLAETDAGQAERMGRKLLKAVNDGAIPHPASPVAPHVTVSVGAATVVPGERLPMESLMERADRALYRAKEKGRNRLEKEES